LPFVDNSFDSVHCGQTLEHVKDEQQVISEIKRVTRGIAIISVPINGGISAQHLRQYDNRTILKALEGSFNILSMKMFHDGRHKRLVLIAE
jgi:ubiquinone/menaquinone biosynthesis C-methylase UbiE